MLLVEYCVIVLLSFYKKSCDANGKAQLDNRWNELNFLAEAELEPTKMSLIFFIIEPSWASLKKANIEVFNHYVDFFCITQLKLNQNYSLEGFFSF